MANYFIGIGGTGARCMEAVVYLASAGLLDGNLHLLIIDPDANNGNSSAVDGLMTHYYLLHRQKQPSNPQRHRMMMRPIAAAPPVLFQANVNHDEHYPARWNPQHRSTDRYFQDIVEYTTRPPKLKSFIDLFYHTDDLNMELEVGYQGRTNVGAVALKQDLEETSTIDQSGLREFLAALTADLQNGETRVFVSGSVFGGTGAAGIPTLPALIKGLSDDALPEAQRANLRWGCALMAPYFIFPRNPATRGNLGPGTDSTRHPVATQAALLHYAHTPPGYQRVYLLGSPNRGQTNNQNHPGGDEQKNMPHYAELAAALAAWDFYSLGKIGRDERKLHYADSYDNNGADLGVSWETMPVYKGNYQSRRDEIKRKLVSFTTFAYLYRNILHDEFLRNRGYLTSDMYKDNFKNLNLDVDAQEQALKALNNLCENYLEWLRGIGRTSGNMLPTLFNWEALETTDIKACEQRVGNLMETGARQANRHPRYSTSGYQKIMEKLNRNKLVSPNTQSAVGLFIYLLYQAVHEFCKENYDWR
jgi:hypothetical protein